jgi:4-hydroxy-3-polyprenylbenzoate decarboxylase
MVDFLVIRVFDVLGLELGSLRRWQGPVAPSSSP